MPNMILLPRAAEELKIPFVASGGMADARSLVAALAMGAAGMTMGTRFIATKEAPVHDNVKKKAIVAASELDTRLGTCVRFGTLNRVLKNAGVERLLDIERERGSKLKIEDIHDEVAGGLSQGDDRWATMDAGAWSCGMVVGLIHDIPTVKELIDRIMVGAERIILARLTGFLDAESKVPEGRLKSFASTQSPRWKTMPTYFCTTLEGRLTAEQKRKMAGEITRVHCEVTGAPSFFAQVIFQEVRPGDYFIGGAPLKHDQLFV